MLLRVPHFIYHISRAMSWAKRGCKWGENLRRPALGSDELDLDQIMKIRIGVGRSLYII